MRALAAAAMLALIAVGVVLSRPGRSGDDGSAASSSPSHRDAADAGAPGGAAGDSGATSRISSAPFTEPVDPEAADPVDSGADDPSVPVPAHLRRVTFTLEFDDGTPLGGVSLRAEFLEEHPAGDGQETASTDNGAIIHGMTNSSGRVSFLIPRAARVRVVAETDSRYPIRIFNFSERCVSLFQSEWFGAEASEARAVVAAVPVRLAVVDDAGRPVPELKFIADGHSPVGTDKATATTDGDGRAVFRGFAAGEALLRIGLDQAGVYFTRDCDRFAVTAVLGGEPFDPESPAVFGVVPPADLKVTVRRMPVVGVRVVDPSGKPVEGALVEFSIVIAGSAVPVSFEPGSTNWDGRYSRPLPLNGKDVGLDAVLAEIGIAVTTRDGRGPYVVVRPGPPPGGNLDAGEVVVPAARMLEFQVTDESGQPVVGADLFPVGPDGLPDPSRFGARSKVDGHLRYPARPTDVRFCCGQAEMTDVFVDAPVFADVAADAAVRKITLRRAASFRFETEGADESRYHRASAVVVTPARVFSFFAAARVLSFWNTDSWSQDEPFPCAVGLGPNAERRLGGIEPGAAVTIEFRDNQGTYATVAATAPAAGETRTIIAPLPPPETTLIVDVADASGRPMNEIKVLVRTIPTVGEPAIVADDDVVDGRCVVAGLRAGRVQVRVDSDPSTDVEVALTAPETKLVVRPPVQRVVVLAFLEPDSDERLDYFFVEAFANDQRLTVLFDRFPKGLPPPPPETGGFVSVRTSTDAPVEFRLSWGGTGYAVTAGPGITRVEWTPPATGRLLLTQLRRAVAAGFELNVRRLETPGGPASSASHSVRTQTFVPSEPRWEWEPIVLVPGRYRIELYETDSAPWKPRGRALELVPTSDVLIVAGLDTTHDFAR